MTVVDTLRSGTGITVGCEMVTVIGRGSQEGRRESKLRDVHLTQNKENQNFAPGQLETKIFQSQETDSPAHTHIGDKNLWYSCCDMRLMCEGKKTQKWELLHLCRGPGRSRQRLRSTSPAAPRVSRAEEGDSSVSSRLSLVEWPSPAPPVRSLG